MEHAVLPMLTRAEGSIGPKTLNEEARTVEVTWTVAGSVVRRSGWDGDFDEELIVSEEAVDMSRLTSGQAPFLAVHDAHELDSVLGVIQEAWLSGPKGRQEGRARIYFDDDPAVERIMRKVKNGILRNVSVGYSVSEWTRSDRKGEVPLMKATRWQPMEVSLVPIGADAGAKVRSDKADRYPCRVVSHEELEMNGQPADRAAEQAAENERAAQIAADAERAAKVKADAEAAEAKRKADAEVAERERAAAVRQERDAAAKAERERCSGILKAVRSLGLADAEADKMIADGVDLNEARARAIDLAAGRQKGQDVRNHHISGGQDEGVSFGRALAESLLARSNPGRHQVTDLVREKGVAQLHLVDIAREVLEFHSIRARGKGPRQIVSEALALRDVRMGGLHHTSDFANILSSTINTTLREEYAAAPATYRAWAAKATLPDFRATNRVQLFGASRPKKANEAGEFQRGTLSEGKESYQLATYGEVIAISRQMIVNDYLGAFNRIPKAMAMAMASLESDLVYSILLANAAMADGTALFHSNHGNVGTAGVIATGTIGEAMTLMATQRDPNSGSPLNFLPRFLLVPPGIRATADTFVSGAFVPNVQTNVIPDYMRNLQPITEARLQTGVTISTEPDVDTTYAGSATAYYLLADSGAVDTVEYSYLEGSEGVYTEDRLGFDVDGVETKARLDFGAKALDWRGMVKNAGG